MWESLQRLYLAAGRFYSSQSAISSFREHYGDKVLTRRGAFAGWTIRELLTSRECNILHEQQLDKFHENMKSMVLAIQENEGGFFLEPDDEQVLLEINKCFGLRSVRAMVNDPAPPGLESWFPMVNGRELIGVAAFYELAMTIQLGFQARRRQLAWGDRLWVEFVPQENRMD